VDDQGRADDAAGDRAVFVAERAEGERIAGGCREIDAADQDLGADRGSGSMVNLQMDGRPIAAQRRAASLDGFMTPPDES
jgi:hypothetical protein